MTDRKAALDKMREPFEGSEIGTLPKPYSKDAKREFCQVCKSTHGMPAAHLEYVGHAAITGRLLNADPDWSWEPLAFGPDGLPAFDRNGGLWIRLTVAGVARLGYGDAQGKAGANAIKEAIGDALRNAAMRFGAALDLWHKGDPLERDEPAREWLAEAESLATAEETLMLWREASKAKADTKTILDKIAKLGKDRRDAEDAAKAGEAAQAEVSANG